MTTFDPHKNLAYALVSVAPAPALTGVTLTVAAGFGALFPVAPFNCTVWPPAVAARQSNAEIVRVTARVGDVMTIVRAQEGTTAKAVAVGWQFANTITVKDLTDVENAVNTIETTGVFDGDAANGDLSGTYPNPTLDVIGVATGPIGDGTDVPVVTIDAKGRVTALTSTPITGAPPGGAAGGDLTGTYPNPGVVLATVLAAGKTRLSVAPAVAGDPVAVGDNDPRNTNSRAPSGAAGGDLTGTYPSPTLALIGAATGPIGNGTTVPVVTIDAKGRVTALTSTPITGAPPSGAAGGVLSGTYPNPGFAVDMATQAELDAAIAALDALCVIKLPTTDARNVIQPSAATVVPLTLKGFAAQSDDLLQFQDSTAAVLARHNKNGWLGIGVDPITPIDININATGSQVFDMDKLAFRSITNFTSPTANVGFDAYANYMEVNYVNVLDPNSIKDHVGGLVVRAIMNVPLPNVGDAGGVAAGTFLAESAVTNTYPMDYLNGLYCQVRHASPRTVPETYAADFHTQLFGGTTGTITTVYDVSAGFGYHGHSSTVTTWNSFHATPPNMANASAVVTTYYGFHLLAYGSGPGHIVDYYGVKLDNPTTTISGTKYAFVADGGQTRLTAGAATEKPLVVKGFAAQSVNLQEWQNSAATVLVSITPAGVIAMNSQKITGLANGSAASDAAAFGQIPTSLPPSGAAGGVLSGTYPNPGFAVDMATQAELDAVAAASVILLPTTDARNVIQPSAATVTPLTVKGFAAQTDPLTEWTDSTPTTLLSVLAGGAIEMLEQTVPATPGANRVRMFSRDSGGGLTQIVAVFPSGNTVVIAEDF